MSTVIIDKIFELFDSTGKTPVELTRHLGLSSGQVTNWKKRGTDPPARYLADICKFFDCPASAILGTDDGEREPLSPNERDVLAALALFDDERLAAKFVGRVEALAEEMLAAERARSGRGTRDLREFESKNGKKNRGILSVEGR